MRKRRDNHHAEIRDGLRQTGYFVADLADCGNGVPDLLAASKTRIAVLIEVKTLDEGLTPMEREFFTHYSAPHVIATSLESALRTMEFYDGMEMVCK